MSQYLLSIALVNFDRPPDCQRFDLQAAGSSPHLSTVYMRRLLDWQERDKVFHLA